MTKNYHLKRTSVPEFCHSKAISSPIENNYLVVTRSEYDSSLIMHMVIAVFPEKLEALDNSKLANYANKVNLKLKKARQDLQNFVSSPRYVTDKLTEDTPSDVREKLISSKKVHQRLSYRISSLTALLTTINCELAER